MSRRQATARQAWIGATAGVALLGLLPLTARGQQAPQPGAGAAPAVEAPPAQGSDTPQAQAMPAPAPVLPALAPDQANDTSYQIPVPSSNGPARPLTLEEAFLLGSHHPALKAAQQSIALADLADNRVLTFWQPQLNATGAYTRYDSEITFGMPDFTKLQPAPAGSPIPFTVPVSQMTIQPQNLYAGILSLQVPLFIGPLLPQLASAKDLQEVARLQFLHGERTFLIQSVAQIYYGAVAAGEAAEVARRTLEVTQKHYDATKRMFEVGQATRLAVLQAEIAVVQGEQKLRQAQTGWLAALRGLEILLAVQGPLQLQHPPTPPLPVGSEMELLARALQQRLDYQAAQKMVTLTERGRSSAAWKWAPTLAANGQYRVSNAQSFNGDKSAWQVGLALNLPLWDGGTRVIDRQEADAKLEQAIEQRHAVESTIANEVNGQLKGVQEAEADLVTMRNAVALAREGVAAAQASFEVGMATNLEVLDANQKLFEMEIGLIQTQIRVDMARLQLAHTVGEFKPLSAEADRAALAPRE